MAFRVSGNPVQIVAEEESNSVKGLQTPVGNTLIITTDDKFECTHGQLNGTRMVS